MQKLPMMLNQPGLEYPAEILRAEHFAATAGGNGVSAPGDMKVRPQPAADGTVQIAPGNATAVSRFAGQANQSYMIPAFTAETLTVPPTGSGGGRTDLVVAWVRDPDHRGESFTPEQAPSVDFWKYEVLQGRDNTNGLPFPVVPLAVITRPRNTTIVTNAHITDVRELTNPKSQRRLWADQLDRADRQSVHTASTVWPTKATHVVNVPALATRCVVLATWGTVLATPGTTIGSVHVRLRAADGTTVETQVSTWVTPNTTAESRFSITLGDTRTIPAAMRGKQVTVEMMGTKVSGSNAYMDGGSSATLDIEFQQDVE